MIQLNPDYEAIFAPNNIDDDCDSIAHKIDVVGLQIKELLKIASEIDAGNAAIQRIQNERRRSASLRCKSSY